MSKRSAAETVARAAWCARRTRAQSPQRRSRTRQRVLLPLPHHAPTPGVDEPTSTSGVEVALVVGVGPR